MRTATRNHEGCAWCQKEISLLHLRSSFSPQEIEAYTSFYGILSEDGPRSLEEVSRKLGRSLEETELLIMEIADWLTANSAFRSLPRRCSVCGHAQEPEDLTHLKETVA